MKTGGFLKNYLIKETQNKLKCFWDLRKTVDTFIHKVFKSFQTD